MNRDTDASADIVWPDEEHLFDVETLSIDERAGSQTSDGWNGLRGATETKANESTRAEVPASLSSANEYWDHDDRNVDAGGLRSVSPPRIGLGEDDSDRWVHDKFDLLKIGPPPGLDIKRKATPFVQHSSSGPQQHAIRRGQPSTVRVLEVPRPYGVGPGLHGRRPTGYQLHDELRAAEGEKIPWPEEVRDADADMWGWPEEAKLRSGPEAAEWSDALQAQGSSASRPPARVKKAQHAPRAPGAEHQNLRQQVSKLPAAEQQNLQQVEQRNSEMAAIFAQLQMQEQVRQAVQARLSQQPYRQDIHTSGALSAFQTGSLQGNAGLQAPFNQQPQLTGHMYQHHMPAPNLAPGHALRHQQQQQQLLQQQQTLSLASSAQAVRPSFSHIGHLQPAQSPRAPPQPNQPAQFPARPRLDQNMAGAGYMHGSKGGSQALTGSPRGYPLKPGHLSASQPALSSMPLGPSSPAAQVSAPAQHAFQPPMQASASAHVLQKRDSKRLDIVDPKSKPAAAKLARASSGASAGKPGKHAIAIVDPSSKQQLSAMDGQPSGSQLDRSDSTSSSTVSTGKRLIAIVDPNNKQPVQMPVKPLGTSRLARSSSNISAASSDSHQPIKRTITIVDPHNKQPVVLPQSQQQQKALPDNARRRAKMPLAIMDPVTSAQVQLPDAQVSSMASKRQSQQLHSRPVRARKPLAIVDPEARGQPAHTASHSMQTSGEAGNAVSVNLNVNEGSSVQCSIQAKPIQSYSHHTRHAAGGTHHIRLSLLAQADGNVTCSISANAGHELLAQ